MNIKFDVIIPLYNKRSSIERCLNSVENQDHKPNSVIIIDDGSTDFSNEVVKALTKSSTLNIQLITQENRGVSVARNRGVSNSISNYICFLDADDEWETGFLSAMSGLILDFPDAVLYCVGHRVVKDKKIYNPKLGYPVDFRGYIDNFFHASKRGSVANSSKVAVLKSAFEDMGGFPEGIKAGEDLYVWAKLAINGSVVCFSKPLVKVHLEYNLDRLNRRGEIPYPLIYFGNHPSQIDDNKGLKQYLIRIGLLHVADSSLNGDLKNGLKRAKALFKISMFSGLISILVVCTPRIILSKLITLIKAK
jgi:glycosyltransferase involved in cell wall biosynthesis